MARVFISLIVVALFAGMVGCAPAVKYSLTVSSSAGGDVTSPGEGTFSCYAGRAVILMAAPLTGYCFVNWTGDVGTIADVSAAQTIITISGDYSIMANFEKSTAGGCFIAAAAYNTPMADEIQVLRRLRDEYLLTNALGQGFVHVYYTFSPPIADFVTRHPSLKPIVRARLLPVVATSAMAIKTTPAEKMAIIGLVALVSVAVAAWATNRRRRGA